MNRFFNLMLITLILSVSGLFAQKQAMSIQGVLRDANGTSVPDASYSIKFNLYTALVGGVLKWSETQSIPVVNGVYSATLGKVNTTLKDLDYNIQYFLGITINGQTEMAPRTELTLSPYAILGGVLGTTNIVPQSGNVGIGTLAPESKLHIVAGGSANPAGNGLYVFNPTNSIGQDAILSSRVAGISSGDPFLSFDVSGESGWALGIDNSDLNKFKIDNTWNSLGNATKLTIDNSGNVGIGTSLPTSKLDIAGDTRMTGNPIINNGSPTIYLQDDNNNSGMIHMNSNILYFLNGSTTNSLSWAQKGSYWPFMLDMTNDNMTFGGNASFMEGNVGIGGASGGDKLTVTGSVRFQNGYIHMNPTVDNTSGNTGIGGTVYGNVKLTVSSNQTYAGYFNGNVAVLGGLSKGGGSFKIDHPLDPDNKFLYHSFVESPDMMNVYNGNIVTDANGTATVQLPSYFESLNGDYRYQLTVIGQFAQAIIGNEVRNNQFVIKTDKPNVKVSWQVTGIRQDAFAKAHPIIPEVYKTAEERGKYLYPVELQKSSLLQLDPGVKLETKE